MKIIVLSNLFQVILCLTDVYMYKNHDVTRKITVVEAILHIIVLIQSLTKWFVILWFYHFDKHVKDLKC